MNIFSYALVLFLIMDPIGNTSSFLKMTKGIPFKKQNRVLVREMLIALFVMFAFSLLGEVIFNVLSISETTVRLTSGDILFLVSIQILFPTLNSIRAKVEEEEPFITPLAIPLIAGPSLLATIILFSHIEMNPYTMPISILAAWLVSVIILLNSSLMERVFTKNGLVALERLMGMILVLLAIQRLLDGLQQFISSF